MVVTPYIKNHDTRSLKPVDLFIAAKEIVTMQQHQRILSMVLPVF